MRCQLGNEPRLSESDKLTENFFMDNHSDLEYQQSRAGKQAIIDTHVEGIVGYLL